MILDILDTVRTLIGLLLPIVVAAIVVTIQSIRGLFDHEYRHKTDTRHREFRESIR